MVLGAVNTPNNWSLSPLDPKDGEKVLKNCTKMIPTLRHAQMLKEGIGLRPLRKEGVRIEYEEKAKNMKVTQALLEYYYCVRVYTNLHLQVIHNYGHGGSGVTLFWGCAKDAVDLFEAAVLSSANKRGGVVAKL